MKNLTRYFNKVSWQGVILILFLLLMSISTIFINWSILDDGVTVMVSQNISSGIRTFDFNFVVSTLVETGSGRFRPFYWVFNWLIYLVGGINVHFFFLVHCTLFIFSSTAIYKIVTSLTKNKTAALVGSLFFAANSLNMENWFRLGPIEPIYGALISGLIFLLFLVYKNRPIKASTPVLYVLVLLLFLTKETSIVLIPFFGIIYLFSRYALGSDKKNYVDLLKKLFIFSILLGILVIPLILHLRTIGNYSSSYQAGIRVIAGHLFSYIKSISLSIYPLFWFVIGFFILRSIHLYLKEEKVLTEMFYWEIFTLFLFLFFLGIQSPWEFPLNRYLLPALVPLSIFWGVEWGRILKIVYFKKYTPYLVSLYFLLFTYSNSFHLINYYFATYKGTEATDIVLNYIAEIAPKNTLIMFNAKEGDDTIEAKYESGYHLKYFYSRPDLNVGYLSVLPLADPKYKMIIISAFVPPSREVVRESDLAKIRWLKLLKTYHFSVPQIVFYPLNSVLSDLLLFRPFKNKVVEVTFANLDWSVYANF